MKKSSELNQLNPAFVLYAIMTFFLSLTSLLWVKRLYALRVINKCPPKL